MGRYVRGTRGFSYKYAYGRQDSNLGALAEWAGVGSGGMGGAMTCQWLQAHGTTELEPVDGVGWLSTVYMQSWPASDVLATLGAPAPEDLEFLIYELAEHWQGVIREVERRMPLPPAAPSGIFLNAGARYALERSQWGELAARIGHGVDPGNPETFEPAAEALWASGEHEFLPFMAVHALRHAVQHDLEHLELVDADPIETNLWEVTADVAGRPGPTWEDRAMHARLLRFLFRKDESNKLFRTLQAERPEELLPAHYLFPEAAWDGKWKQIEELATTLLAVERPVSERVWLLRWRGEARWTRKDKPGVRADAQEAEALGDRVLADALKAEK